MPPETDVAIAGAGTAGAVAALLLCRARVSVTLVDPGRPVAPRLESLPANGQALAYDLGLSEILGPARLGLLRATVIDWRQDSERRAHDTAPPWLMHRASLHGALRSAALAAGARLLTAQVAQVAPGALRLKSGGQSLSARVVIDARGRSASGLDRLGPPRVALPFRARPVRPVPICEMGVSALPEGWLWWCTRPDGALEGVYFCAPGSLAGHDEHSRATRLAQVCATAAALPDLTEITCGRPVAASLDAGPEALPAPRVIRIGDAALARDPIGAHGLVHALRGAAQAAAAAMTYLQRPGTADAAEAFLRLRHAADCKAVRAATARAYADQSRHATAFWRAGGQGAQPPAALRAQPAPGHRLRLVARLTRVPLLSGGLIGWSDGLALPGQSEGFARFGPFSARDLASALAEPATHAQLTTRLARIGPPAAAVAALDHLWNAGALAPCDLPAETARL